MTSRHGQYTWGLWPLFLDLIMQCLSRWQVKYQETVHRWSMTYSGQYYQHDKVWRIIHFQSSKTRTKLWWEVVLSPIQRGFGYKSRVVLSPIYTSLGYKSIVVLISVLYRPWLQEHSCNERNFWAIYKLNCWNLHGFQKLSVLGCKLDMQVPTYVQGKLQEIAFETSVTEPSSHMCPQLME